MVPNNTKHWPTTTLGSICARITKGSTPTSYGFQFQNNGIKFIKTENINSNGIISNIQEYIDVKTHDFLERSKLRENDILFSIAGTIGRISLVHKNLLPANTNQALAIIRISDRRADHRFVMYFLVSPPIQSLILKKIVGVGRANLSLTNLSEIEIPLPPLEEQKKIVEKIEQLFSELESGVAALKKAKEQIKLYRQSVLSAAFSGRLTAPERLHGIQEVSRSNKNKQTSAENDTLIAAEPDAAYTTNLPEGWKWYSISDIANDMIIGMVKSSKEQSSTKDGVPYIKMNNIDMEGSVDLKEVVYVKATNVEIKKYELLKGDILFNTRNSYELVGKTGIVNDSNVKRVFNNNLLRIRVKCEFNPKFINYQMNSSAFREKLKSGKRATTNICAIYQKDLFPLTLSIPDKYIQDLIVAEIEKRFAEADNMEKTIDESLAKAEALKQSILKQAFEGKLA